MRKFEEFLEDVENFLDDCNCPMSFDIDEGNCQTINEELENCLGLWQNGLEWSGFCVYNIEELDLIDSMGFNFIQKIDIIQDLIDDQVERGLEDRWIETLDEFYWYIDDLGRGHLMEEEEEKDFIKEWREKGEDLLKECEKWAKNFEILENELYRYYPKCSKEFFYKVLEEYKEEGWDEVEKFLEKYIRELELDEEREKEVKKFYEDAKII